MKYQKAIFTVLLSFTVFYGFGQLIKPKESLFYYNKGLEFFSLEKYQEADSLFTLAAKKNPDANTFYNLALTKYHLKDHCGFCNNLRKAKELGDQESEDLYVANCLKKSVIVFDSTQHPDSILYLEKSEYYYDKNKTKLIYYIRNKLSDY